MASGGRDWRRGGRGVDRRPGRCLSPVLVRSGSTAGAALGLATEPHDLLLDLLHGDRGAHRGSGGSGAGASATSVPGRRAGARLMALSGSMDDRRRRLPWLEVGLGLEGRTAPVGELLRLAQSAGSACASATSNGPRRARPVPRNVPVPARLVAQATMRCGDSGSSPATGWSKAALWAVAASQPRPSPRPSRSAARPSCPARPGSPVRPGRRAI